MVKKIRLPYKQLQKTLTSFFLLLCKQLQEINTLNVVSVFIYRHISYEQYYLIVENGTIALLSGITGVSLRRMMRRIH